jgi:hypothetical protein
VKAVSTSKTSFNFYETRRCNIPEGCHLQTVRPQMYNNLFSSYPWLLVSVGPYCIINLGVCLYANQFLFTIQNLVSADPVFSSVHLNSFSSFSIYILWSVTLISSQQYRMLKLISYHVYVQVHLSPPNNF